MLQIIPIENAKRNLDSLVKEMRTGETIMLVGADGEPIAALVSVKSSPTIGADDWTARWDALAKEVSRTWTSDKNAVEVLQEMRR
jgi:antitoxin (DNA-binding transcriptional repressor) of toxin-antitoxin stability system